MTYSPKIWLKHTQSTSYKDECTAFQWSESHLLLISPTNNLPGRDWGLGLVIIIIYHIWWFSSELFQSSFEIWYFLHMSMWSKSGVVSPKADGVLINYRGVMYPHSSAPPQGHEHARHRHCFRTNPVIFALLSSCYPESRGHARGPTLTRSLMTKLLQQNMIFS